MKVYELGLYHTLSLNTFVSFGIRLEFWHNVLPRFAVTATFYRRQNTPQRTSDLEINIVYNVLEIGNSVLFPAMRVVKIA